MSIKLMSAVLFVRDMQASRRFYEALLGQEVELDLDVNVAYKGGFALWQREHAESIIYGEPQEAPATGAQRPFELYFETDDIADVWQQLELARVQVVHPIQEQPWGQQVFRIYDPDSHMVEIGEAMTAVVRRFLEEGLTVVETAARTSMPIEMVRELADELNAPPSES